MPGVASAGLEAEREKCKANLELSLSNCTILAPVIGYDKAAKIAKVAFETNRTIRQVAAGNLRSGQGQAGRVA